MKRSLALLVLLAALASGSPASGQGRGDYFNVESPPVHPIEVFRLGGHDYLAVASTRDSSIEVWDTDETLPVANRRLARIPVGQEPVSVRWNARRSSLYTANFLGDSVSVIVVSAPSGPASFTARLDQTVFVGDEPLDIAFYVRTLVHQEELDKAVIDPVPVKQDTLFITHMALDGFDWRDAQSFVPINGFEMAPALVTTLFDADGNGTPETPIPVVVKEPRTVLVRDGKLLILGSKGGKLLAGFDNLDLDLYCDTITSLGTSALKIGGLGSAGFNMAFDGSGNLFVVGFEALNESLFDEPNVAAAATGFSKSMLWRVAGACSGTPTVLARDLNALNSPSGPVPVAKADALGMPMDVVVFATGGVPKIFVTAYGSSGVGVIRPDLTLPSPLDWARSKIAIAPFQPPTGNPNPLAGPRGLALKAANPAQPNDPGARLYVLNHLDASVATLDPVTETEVAGGDLKLAVDPRPGYLVAGQLFLYDHELSGNGFVACATCHIDGRTDRLAWDLGTPGVPGLPIPQALLDSVPVTHWPDDKGLLITQSLQGLLNFEIAPADLFWTTNAPYHWRGDRADFTQFLPAFNSLLGMAAGTEPTAPQMKQFEEFVNTMHYPPNPEQAKSRQPTGVWDTATNTFTFGNNGLRIYHQRNTDGVACVHCHALTEGSNNRITEDLGQPVETAALRGLLQKQAKRDPSPASDPRFSPYSGVEGLFHTGLVPNPTANPVELVQDFNLTASINGFNKTGFGPALCGAPGIMCPDLEDLNRIVHEFDWGTGPLVGCPVTARTSNAASLMTGASAAGCAQACGNLPATLNCMEQEARAANSGIAVQARLGVGTSGFYFDPLLNAYVPEGSAGGPLRRNAVLALLTAANDRIQFQAVPLGNERRLAAPSGTASTLSGPAPANLRLLPLKPNTFYTNVPALSGLWVAHDNSFRKSPFVHSLRLFQWGLAQDAAAQNGFGFGAALHHDAPRRFQVSGNNILPGAQLFVGYWNSATGGPPNPALPVNPAQVGLIAFPLFPTDRTDPGNGDAPIYETAVELEPLLYYGLMLGGPFAPGVAAAFVDYGPTFTFPMVNIALDQPPAGSFDPINWNWLHIWVANSATSFTAGGWQRLTLQ